MKIEGSGLPFRIDTKRFYLPEVIVSDKCPKCGETCIQYFDGHYFTYPLANEPFTHTLTCEADGCYHEWTVQLVLVVELKLAEEKKENENGSKT